MCVQIRRIVRNADMIHPGRTAIGSDSVEGRPQRGDGIELVDQAKPFASGDPPLRGSPASVLSKPSVRPLSR
jgi:hypothetical protein